MYTAKDLNHKDWNDIIDKIIEGYTRGVGHLKVIPEDDTKSLPRYGWQLTDNGLQVTFHTKTIKHVKRPIIPSTGIIRKDGI